MLNKKLQQVSVNLFFSLLSTLYFLLPNAEAGADTAADFLKLGIGARASALGEAFCAVADSVDAIYYNPAGLARLKQKEVCAMYGDKREDTARTSLVYAQPLQEWEAGGVLGIGIIYQDLGEIELRDKSNQPQGSINPAEFAVIFSYAKKYYENLLLGGNVKYIQRELKKIKAKGAAFDLGLLYFPQIPKSLNLSGTGLTTGLCLENIGSKIKGDELPLNLRLGVAYSALNNLTCSLDVNQHLYNSDLCWNLGLEYRYSLLAVRLGYFDKGRQIKGLSYGFGIKYLGYQLDFANLASGEMEDAEDMNRISLSVSW
ncbi:MAG: PorV/PorQ family protein [bacterium]